MSTAKFTQYSELYYGLRVPASSRVVAKIHAFGHNYSGIHKYTKISTFLKTSSFRKLTSCYKRNRGRTLCGTTTVYTKSSVSKKLFISYAKTTNNFCGLAITVGVEKDVLTFKMAALILSMDASVRFVPLTKKMGLFRLLVAAKIAKHAIKKGANYRLYEHRFCDLISMLKPKEPASFIPVRSKDTPTIARAAGEAAVVISRSRSVKKTTVIVKLPSDQIKLIDSLSMVLLGSIVVARKLVFKNTKAGYWRNLGYKPMTRGVVKNPVDHPHGGRERTILWPRTPWGKSTK